MRLRVLLLILLLLPALAEDPPNPQVAVLNPSTGKALGHYLLMWSMQKQIEEGNEDPHFEFLRDFCFTRRSESNKPDEGDPNAQAPYWEKQHKVWLGTLPSGDRLIWFHKDGSFNGGYGPLKIVDPQGRQRVLLKRTQFGAAARSYFLRDPRACTAGPYLLVEEPAGVSCRLLETGELLWRSNWNFGYCRWNLGAWYQDGALYANTSEGLARLDPSSGKIRWTWPEAEEVTRVELCPDGLLYVYFIYGPKRKVMVALGEAAVARYNWPVERGVSSTTKRPYADFKFWIRTIPYKDTYFGTTWYCAGENPVDYLKRGKVAVWEYLDGKWSWIFDYDCEGTTEESLNALYAKHRFSPRMRKLLTSDTLATVYRSRDNKLGPEPKY